MGSPRHLLQLKQERTFIKRLLSAAQLPWPRTRHTHDCSHRPFKWLIHGYFFACRNHSAVPPSPPPSPTHTHTSSLLSSAGRFTDLPSNMTVKEGQNIEMACAFQSGTASVYLEIQWWFVKAPEPTDSEEDVEAEEVQRTFLSPFSPPSPLRAARVMFNHTQSKGIRLSNKYPRYYAQAPYVICVVLVRQLWRQCQALLVELFVDLFSPTEQRVMTFKSVQLLPKSDQKLQAQLVALNFLSWSGVPSYDQEALLDLYPHTGRNIS